MKILVIDNIDSFVYNLVQYIGELGAEPVVFTNDAKIRDIERAIREKNIKGILISPGPKTPKEAGVSNDIIKKFTNTPILGVCLGHQCIGHVFGGKIRHAKTLKHGKTSMIEHDGSGVLKGVPSPFEAIRYHSLVVDGKNLPECLEATAKSTDDNEIMALKHRKYPVYGVQFHPESILTANGMQIVKNFLDICGGKD
ncbi:MAG: anthranilate/aminodeoxychorismate synthase component II [Candidatus Altiarchaeales archaeon IMC4]|nr:MAG: anthranilate/aminodeoxychorismate synthase component II [Candidatus Altiarchaeales archaeon IMC4]